MAFSTIHSHHHHCGWRRDQAAVLTVAPGDTVEFDVLEASGGTITPESVHADLHKLSPERANPVTGPVWIDGAEPGDTLRIDIVDFAPSGWGWTALIPGFGLLADDFPEPFLHHSHHDSVIAFTPDIELPLRPFPGTLGVAPACEEHLSAIPPYAWGGNLDYRDLTRGASLYLPVQVPGALFSVGDTHAAQGHGEVCGTAIESPMEIRLRFDLIKNSAHPIPRADIITNTTPPAHTRRWVTLGVADDLHRAAADAVRQMIERLNREYGLAEDLGYCLCSVAGDLQIAQLVNAPNWTVGFSLPLDIFR